MNAQAINTEKLNAFVNRTFNDISSAYGGVMISIGHKLGLYRAMAGAGPLSTRELAQRSDCAERYVREWLNSQAAAFYVDYHSHSDTYELTAEQALVLADETSPLFIPNAWQAAASLWFDEEKTLTAFRTGKGVAWGEHDSRLHCGSAAFYRNGYKANLISQWLPALDGVIEKLNKGIRVADIGCGHGHSSILMAQAFPKSQFFGFDTHVPSLEHAITHAKNADVENRITFEHARATEYPQHRYDLICFFDCLHDMGDPVAAARYAAQSLAPDGSVMLVEPFAEDNLEENLSPISRIYYTASSCICCAHSISEGGQWVLGAQAGEKRLAEVFRKAGFSYFRRVAQTPFNLVFEARV